MAERDMMLSVTNPGIADSVLPEDSTNAWPDSDVQISSLPQKSRAVRESEIEVASPEQVHLEAELNEARAVIMQLEAETLRIADEHNFLKELLLRQSVSSANSAAVVPSITGIQDQSYNKGAALEATAFVGEQVWRAAVKVQSVMRGHFGRCMFRARCSSVERDLIDEIR